MNKSLCDIEQQIDILKMENAKRELQIERLEYSNSTRQSEINALKLRLDEFEQEKHEACAEIVGFPENKDESDDIKQLTKVIKKQAGVKIKSSDVVEIRRLRKKSDGQTRNAIVKFKDKETKEKIGMQKRKLIKSGNPAKSVYLNDCLTQHRQQLLYSAQQLVKARILYAAWSQHGNILVKTRESSKIIQIHDFTDLMIAKTDETEHDHDRKTYNGPCEDTVSQMTHLSTCSHSIVVTFTGI